MTDSDRQQWRFFECGPESAYFHMAMDDVLVRRFSRGESLSVFRVYQWREPAITVGYAQHAGEYLDLGKCSRDGIEVTRRLTGGRAVFHGNEIAYAVIGSVTDPVFGGGIRDTYRSIHAAIIEAFRAIGTDSLREEENPEHRVSAPFRKLAPCFASPTRFELTLDGRKVVGSAQRRFQGVFLQQGSIRLGPGAERIAEYLLDKTARRVFQQELSETGGCAESGKIIDRKKLTNALFEKFGERVQMQPSPDNLTEEELDTITKLSISRYQSPEWVENHGQQPDL